jgi:hypothetical protein
VAPNQSVDFQIEYFIPDRRTVPKPVLVADAVGSQIPPSVSDGPEFKADRVLPLSDGRILVEFLTIANRTYVIQYGERIGEWKTASPPIIGTGSRLQWIDSGPPKTESHPKGKPGRFYRIIRLP